ncbi:MAG: hypothetical protein COA96_03040 [SAR86 cluster bacterium]|uniref:Uncharacterized protein n=1 Tax=SAR86 cluster bacterium TaxID=2030880 RepID=A0A2A5B7I0_9GAMM|nr:MAG: hypothetical protein COA96_03040 [SAR86 cluster bacterium]
MVISYALENKSTVFIASFAFGCALAAYYAYMIESYPFMVAESIWSIIALWRWMSTRNKPAIPDDSDQG